MTTMDFSRVNGFLAKAGFDGTIIEIKKGLKMLMRNIEHILQTGYKKKHRILLAVMLAGFLQTILFAKGILFQGYLLS